MSQVSSVYADEGAVPIEAEGFLCLLEPGVNYLCPVCKARLDNAADLELHFSVHNSASSAARAAGDTNILMQEINSLTSSLNEERYTVFLDFSRLYWC